MTQNGSQTFLKGQIVNTLDFICQTSSAIVSRKQ